MASETTPVRQQEEPPPYSTAIEANGPDDSPPSFYDVMGLSKLRNDIRTTKKELRNPAIMIFKICCICLGCLCLGSLACAAIVFLLYGALPISLLVVGAVHIGDCELDERIPKWMVVYGSVSLAYSVLNILKSICCSNRRRQCRRREEGSEEKQSLTNRCASSIEGILHLFLFVWLIVGSVWVLGKYNDWDDAGRPNCDESPKNGNCCHEGMFLFAFIFIITMWSLTFLIICCIFSCACIIFAIAG